VRDLNNYLSRCSSSRIASRELKTIFGLLALEPFKLIHCKEWKRDGAALVGLGGLKTNSYLGLLEALHYAQGAPLEVDILPAQRKHFATPHTCSER
jgi:hypothetical protein